MVSQILNIMYKRRWFFSKTSWKKAYFIAKMSGPAMVWLASSDFWKAPQVIFIPELGLNMAVNLGIINLKFGLLISSFCNTTKINLLL